MMRDQLEPVALRITQPQNVLALTELAVILAYDIIR
jgi:hypothetical protein